MPVKNEICKKCAGSLLYGSYLAYSNKIACEAFWQIDLWQISSLVECYSKKSAAEICSQCMFPWEKSFLDS